MATVLHQQPMLELDRCPHCGVVKPLLENKWEVETKGHSGRPQRHWAVYVCRSCGGAVLTGSYHGTGGRIDELYPAARQVAQDIPERARAYLIQASASLHAPAGAVMLVASAVDAMLKDKGYKEGSLYERINQAVAKHVITEEMAAWAHEIRLDANDQRHADEAAGLPNEADAERVIEFALALGGIFVRAAGKSEAGPQCGYGPPGPEAMTTALYVVLMAAVIVAIDVLFFKNRFWERLTVNVGIVLVFAAFYFRFLKRP